MLMLVCDACGLPAAGNPHGDDRADRGLPGSIGLYEQRRFETVHRGKPSAPPWARDRKRRR